MSRARISYACLLAVTCLDVFGCGTEMSQDDDRVSEASGGEAPADDHSAVEHGAGKPRQSVLPNVTVWIAGDSTVANGSTPCPRGWGGHFKPFFNSQVTVINSAVAGRSVRTWLFDVLTTMDSTGECLVTLDAAGAPVLQARWRAMLTGMKAGDYLFIQFGINDSSPTCNRHVGLDAFKQSYGLMAQAAKARGVHPIFVTPLSAIACAGTVAQGTRRGYVPATQQAGVQFGVPVIDLHQKSVNLYNSLKFCPIPGGTDVTATTPGPVGAFFCADHTHLEDAGAVQIAGLVAAAVRDQGIGLAAYLQ
jgi:lysophospholipase L1-like esterase